MVSLKKLGWENYTNQVIEGPLSDDIGRVRRVDRGEVDVLTLPQPEKFEHYRIAKEQNQ